MTPPSRTEGLRRSRRLRRRGRLAWARFARTTEESVTAFFAHRGPQFAAAIAFYALFAIFPLAILVVVAFGVVIGDDDAREHVVTFLLDNLPLSADQGRRDLERLLAGVTRDTGALGAVGIGGLVLSASGLMGAARSALNEAFDADLTAPRRPPLQGKALDVLLVFGAGLVIGLSLVLTVAVQVAARKSAELDWLGSFGGTLADWLLKLGPLIPVLLALAVFWTLYVVVPMRRVRFRDVWPGAVVAALGYELVKTGFGVYLDGFADYSAVYGSLGAVVAFLVFVLLAAGVFLLGAEVAARWPAVRDAGEDDLLAPGEPIGPRVRRLLVGLARRTE
ncbi:MAG TPA: YihY/virulence factor BrkB family protein [Capillimicrobium sp.]|nr:YihY/virulence factor BrkB family protein [Capillimicrobium sp.]